VLYCAGEVPLLGVDGIGVVGSRDVGPEGVEVTRKVAHLVADSGLPVVSGGAKGVDSISMAATYEAGGRAVGVLADSLERAIGQAESRRAMLDGRACLCTPYRPDARFTTGSAMGRNKIVYGLSRVTLVVASAEGEGGTWSGATEALKKRYGRVVVWTADGSGPGNDALVRAGAASIEQPEAILGFGPVEPSSSPDDSQIALPFDAVAPPGEATTDPSDPAGGAA
jgi:DNA processing protein